MSDAGPFHASCQKLSCRRVAVGPKQPVGIVTIASCEEFRQPVIIESALSHFHTFVLMQTCIWGQYEGAINSLNQSNLAVP